eukprot:scaffold3144_cov260-Pinguiococcus_pyrenoidosus.AAC.9
MALSQGPLRTTREPTASKWRARSRRLRRRGGSSRFPGHSIAAQGRERRRRAAQSRPFCCAAQFVTSVGSENATCESRRALTPLSR